MKGLFLSVFIFGLLFSFFSYYLQHLIPRSSGFISLTLCNNIFLAHRTYESIRDNEFRATTSIPLDLLMKSNINYQTKEILTTINGNDAFIQLFSQLFQIQYPRAKYLNNEFGCQLIIEPYTSMNPLIYSNSSISYATTSDSSSVTPPPPSSNPQTSPPTSTPPSSPSSSPSIDHDSQHILQIKRKSFHPEYHFEINFPCLKKFLDYEFTPTAMKINQTRAIIITHRGEIIYEKYQNLLNITSSTPLLGWSMTKSILSILLGVALYHHHPRADLTLDTSITLKSLTKQHQEYLLYKNNNKNITFRHLLNMNDILHIEEDYSILGPITQFLYETYDINKFTNQFPSGDQWKKQPPKHFTDTSSPSSSSNLQEEHPFGWYYSSAVTNLLSSEFRQLFDSDLDYWSFPSKYLYQPLQLENFHIGMDPSGTFIGSSFGYGTARDWNKFGELLLNDGKWRHIGGGGGDSGDEDDESIQEIRLLSSDYVKYLLTTTPRSGGYYGGHVWMNPAHADDFISSLLPQNHPRREQLQWLHQTDKEFSLPIPSDTVFFSGYHGQYVLIIPSRELVITRLGMTENDPKIWNPKRFFGTILQKCWKGL